MNIIARPPETNEPYEDLLRAFFRSEMPEPWPELKRPEPRVLPFVQRTNRFASVRSRLALAASVVLLLVGSWLVSGALRNNAGDDSHAVPGTNTANPKPETMPPKHLPKVPGDRR